VLTSAQHNIFEDVKTFVMENRAASAAKLSLPNVFPAKERTFITKLSDDLHLNMGLMT
jgi:5'-3' exoribonuclease 1